MDQAAREPSRPEPVVLGYCRNCGRSVLEGGGRAWQGALHCMDCIVRLSHETAGAPASGPGMDGPEGAGGRTTASARSQRAPFPAPSAQRSPSSVLALILGLIPGVGAVYNGQYAKGVLHVMVFGGLVSTLASGAWAGSEAVAGGLVALMVFYMPIEAFRTARALERGEPVDELSGLLPSPRTGGGSPAAGILLIALGIVFLLQSLGYWRMVDLVRYWPVTLIVVGIYILYRRVTEGAERDEQPFQRRRADLSLSPRGGADLADQRSPEKDPATPDQGDHAAEAGRGPAESI